MAGTKEKATVDKPKAKKQVKYSDVLESRAQRGEMTHQKKLAFEKRQQKETKGA